jgi:hypothetical protein
MDESEDVLTFKNINNSPHRVTNIYTANNHPNRDVSKQKSKNKQIIVSNPKIKMHSTQNQYNSERTSTKKDKVISFSTTSTKKVNKSNGLETNKNIYPLKSNTS